MLRKESPFMSSLPFLRVVSGLLHWKSCSSRRKKTPFPLCKATGVKDRIASVNLSLWVVQPFCLCPQPFPMPQLCSGLLYMFIILLIRTLLLLPLLELEGIPWFSSCVHLPFPTCGSTSKCTHGEEIRWDTFLEIVFNKNTPEHVCWVLWVPWKRGFEKPHLNWSHGKEVLGIAKDHIKVNHK